MSLEDMSANEGIDSPDGGNQEELVGAQADFEALQGPETARSTGPFFPEQQHLAALAPATFSDITAKLAQYDINFIWNDTADENDPRAGFRPDYNSIVGEGASLMMPISGCYCSRPGVNGVYLPEGIDRGLVAYMQESGFLGEAIFVPNVKGVLSKARERGVRVYAIDDFDAEYDSLLANSQRDMRIVNSKEWVTRLSGYAAPEWKVDVSELSERHFLEAWEPGRKVFLKTCNTESAGLGVFPVSSLEEFRATRAELQQRTERFGLNPLVIVQPELVGQNKSFQVFIDPDDRSTISVIALTNQFVEADGKTFSGNQHLRIDAANLRTVAPAMVDLVERIFQNCPDAKGYVMCDYFEEPSGKVTLFDPGLRPTGNTAATMVKLWLAENGQENVQIENAVFLDFGEKDLPFDEVRKRLGPLLDVKQITDTGYGVLPWGYNHLAGNGLFILSCPSSDDMSNFKKDVLALCQPQQ